MAVLDRNACGVLVNRTWVSGWSSSPTRKYIQLRAAHLQKAHTGCQVRRQKLTSATVVQVDGPYSWNLATNQPDRDPTSQTQETYIHLIFECEDVIRGMLMHDVASHIRLGDWGNNANMGWGFQSGWTWRTQSPPTWVTLKRIPLGTCYSRNSRPDHRRQTIPANANIESLIASCVALYLSKGYETLGSSRSIGNPDG